MKLVSVCIPTYEMHGLGDKYLKHSFDILTTQTFKDFDVVISDHSKTDVIKNLCEEYKDILDIHYFRNAENIGNSSANINNAIKNAKGKLIKILFQDDFLYNAKSLEVIVNNFDLKRDNWLITACEHSEDGITFYRPFYPKYNKAIYLGNNTISSPSVLTIINENPLLFDEKLIWLMDCDYYKRCYDKYGEPKILNTINVVNRIGDYQVSNTITNKSLKDNEYNYILKKYNKKMSKNLILKKVTLVAVSSIKIDETIMALEQSMSGIDYHEVILISHKKPEYLNKEIKFKQCQPLNSIDDYNRFMIYDLAKYIDTEFSLVVQHDGYVLRPHRWNNIFLNYDYIGATWPKNMFFNNGVNIRVGNGGFSLRSKKLLNAFNELKLPFSDNNTGYFHEDGIICNYYRKELEKYEIKFAPVEIASMFSRELDCDDSIPEHFGFHKNKKVIPKLILVKSILNKLQHLGINFIKNTIKKTINIKEKKWVKKLIPNNAPIILEIGSANGDDTLEFIKTFRDTNLTLYGFEPEPKNIKILKKRINDKSYKLFEGVVSDVDGKLIFNLSRTDNPNDLSLSGSIMKPKNHLKIWDWIYFDQTIEVDSITLDSFCIKNNVKIIDFIWCDAQGAEEKIIIGGENTFKNKVKYFYVEYSNDEQYENQPKLEKILNLLPSFEIVENFGTDILLKNKNL
ncbi:MAG: hypothetical protein BWK75_02465 [Candidatus Altiarchaeales archaeon A3]|nr:MAG: hypothetical protein BWK75_02465 [Candidatus Altiarchaeales archaeon A3]